MKIFHLIYFLLKNEKLIDEVNRHSQSPPEEFSSILWLISPKLCRFVAMTGLDKFFLAGQKHEDRSRIPALILDLDLKRNRPSV